MHCFGYASRSQKNHAHAQAHPICALSEVPCAQKRFGSLPSIIGAFHHVASLCCRGVASLSVAPLYSLANSRAVQLVCTTTHPARCHQALIPEYAVMCCMQGQLATAPPDEQLDSTSGGPVLLLDVQAALETLLAAKRPRTRLMHDRKQR